LEAPASELQEVKVTQQPPGFATQFANFFGMKISASLAPPIEIDPWFQSKTNYLNDLEVQINALANAYSSLIYRQQELAEIHRVIFMTSKAISGCENESDRDLADAFDGLSTLHSQLQPLDRELAQESKTAFEDVLRDYSRMISSAKDMLAYRSEKLGLYQESIIIAKTKKDRYEKLKETSANPPPTLESEIQRCERQSQAEKELFEATSKNCKSELEKFELSKTKELFQALSCLVQANINYEVRVANLWKSYLSKLTPD